MFKYPSDCSDDCQYFASWQMQEDAVKFYVASTDLDKWIGIGISSNSFMVKFLLSGESGWQFIFLAWNQSSYWWFTEWRNINW